MGLRSFERDTGVKLRFVVGHFQEPADQAVLDEEQQRYNDFLVLDVKETYENLILKVPSLSKHQNICCLLQIAYESL